ncbi:MAG: DUF3592 domain-containing protein [Verrucomicrobiota bacterium]|nr:DUF3592 domain-containing protein [Verrucomicrobiota bacterium]
MNLRAIFALLFGPYTACICLVAGLVLGGFGLKEKKLEQRLATEGVKGEATVTKVMLPSRNNDSGALSLHYTDRDGAAHDKAYSIDKSLVDKFTVGQTLPIVYLASQPDSVRVDASVIPAASGGLITVGAVFIGFGALGLLWTIFSKLFRHAPAPNPTAS